MKKLLCGLAVVPLFSAAVFAQPASSAQPMRLSEAQMDTVTAGFTFQSEDVTNTSWTQIRIWQAAQMPGGNDVICNACYIKVSSPALSVGSAFGPSPG